MTTMVQRMQQMARPRGRPREFDVDQALDKAIKVFREQGYNATSIEDLTGAMGLASGSIYKAFKDKRAVFLAALDRYMRLRNDQIALIAGTRGTARERLRAVLGFYVDSAKGIEGRRGCMVVGSAVELAIVDREVATRVGATLARNEAFLADLIRQGQADGSISGRIDPDDTARVMVCLTQGLRVVGKSGRAPADTAAAVDIAMRLLA
ncbi:TetR/AcrR family transcriptional regulator [Bradyrhizobium mercantei]|uniref:TetR/AcrR family transcriptional regulator n=1 Tax=Bradyrhizobium mercantei TaxID=1904807 RepID=UPI00097631E7|nr:TetR/AcrR family transcriptional regulator [Bradyrhizobium mercantei]